MVRFHWHVEDGGGAWIPPGGIAQYKDTGVQHAACEIELPGEGVTVEACFTVPPHFLVDKSIRDVGIVLGHPEHADAWNGRLLTELAVALAMSGFLVVRYFSRGRELRRVRLYEKALDACATSPFARHVNRWVLAGVGDGARVAAIVGGRCRGTIGGFVLLSYPLLEPFQLGKGPVQPDSIPPLLRCQAPVLLVAGDADVRCPPDRLRALAPRLASTNVRLLTVAGVDAGFRASDGVLHPKALGSVVGSVLEFVAGVAAEDLASCTLPCIKAGGGVAVDGGAGAGDDWMYEGDDGGDADCGGCPALLPGAAAAAAQVAAAGLPAAPAAAASLAAPSPGGGAAALPSPGVGAVQPAGRVALPFSAGGVRPLQQVGLAAGAQLPTTITVLPGMQTAVAGVSGPMLAVVQPNAAAMMASMAAAMQQRLVHAAQQQQAATVHQHSVQAAQQQQQQQQQQQWQQLR